MDGCVCACVWPHQQCIIHLGNDTLDRWSHIAVQQPSCVNGRNERVIASHQQVSVLLQIRVDFFDGLVHRSGFTRQTGVLVDPPNAPSPAIIVQTFGAVGHRRVRHPPKQTVAADVTSSQIRIGGIQRPVSCADLEQGPVLQREAFVNKGITPVG